MSARRGAIWLIDFGEPIGREQSGRRPAVVVSDDEVNDGPSELVIVIPITSTRRGLPSHIELDDPATGLEEISYAKCEDVTSVSTERLITRVGVAPVTAVFAIERALRFLLAL